MLAFIMFSQLVNVFDKERVLAVNTDCHDVFNMAGGWGTCEASLVGSLFSTTAASQEQL